MKRKKAIQLQASIQKPISSIIHDARSAMNDRCMGIDDMCLLGNKALVMRAEIYPEKLPEFYSDLASLDIKLAQHSLPNKNILKNEVEYIVFLQITSYANDTDGKINILKIPG